VDDALHYIYSFKGTPVAVITLTTDYGWRDPDSAGLRGRVYAEMLRTGTVAPVVDLTHSIPSRNLNEAAYILRGAYSDFPAGSVHIVLVDSIHWPNTPLIACSIDGHHFLGLDNGLLAMIRPDVQPSTRVQLDLKNRLDCSTAESLLAAAAAHLLDGGSPSLLGPSRSEWVERSVLKPEVRSPQAALVHIQYVDHYGQLVTDADQAWLQRWHMGQPFETNVRGQRVRQWWGESGLPSGSLYFRTNRHQLLEIGMVDGGSDSVNQAARLLGMKPGDALELKLR
jgi:S-adenosylmethionine hydrolase